MRAIAANVPSSPDTTVGNVDGAWGCDRQPHHGLDTRKPGLRQAVTPPAPACYKKPKKLSCRPAYNHVQHKSHLCGLIPPEISDAACGPPRKPPPPECVHSRSQPWLTTTACGRRRIRPAHIAGISAGRQACRSPPTARVPLPPAIGRSSSSDTAASRQVTCRWPHACRSSPPVHIQDRHRIGLDWPASSAAENRPDHGLAPVTCVARQRGYSLVKTSYGRGSAHITHACLAFGTRDPSRPRNFCPAWSLRTRAINRCRWGIPVI